MKSSSIVLVVLLGALCADARAQDVPMNPPDDFGTLDNSTTQSETNHAVAATGMLAAWNDSSQIAMAGVMGFASLVGWGYSRDGTSFTGGGFFNCGDKRKCMSDPAVVADSAGFFYLAALTSRPDAGDQRRDLAVARSKGNTAPFDFGMPAILKPKEIGDSLDKGLMAIDRTGSASNDRIYISATESGRRDRIVVAYTESLSPLNFLALQFVSKDGPGIFSTGSMPAVAPNGHVYVIWTTNGNTLQIVKSTDRGEHFSDPQTIATFKPVQDLLTPGEFQILTIRTPALAQIAIDSTARGSPTRGNVYVVYAADPDGAGCDKGDIYFTRSTDGGVTWMAPRSITSGLAATLGQDPTTNDNWMPSIAVSPVNGHIYVTFYDRRNDSSNTVTRVFRALSTDGGLTWVNAKLGEEPFVPILGFPQVGANSYWGDYNWSTADVDGMHFTWGDSHKLCAPPHRGRSKCRPRGRPDLDAYYHRTTKLSGADLFIQPWGAVTGIGPTWQTPDVFVVDRKTRVVNAQKGKVNLLRARVRNLGNVAANGVVVRFRYAPWFAGVNDSLLKEIGTVRLNFSAAGGATDTQIAKINWDLTNLSDTNGGRWPKEIGKFEHFCVKVSVEFAGDINLSNNAAQNNFADIKKAAWPKRAPFLFMITGPDKTLDTKAKLTQLRVSELPEGFSARVSLQGAGDPEGGFPLQPDEIRLAEVKFAAPKRPRLQSDVVADVTLLLDGKPASGISARLYRSPLGPGDLHGIGSVTSAYWDVKPPPKPPDQPSTPGFERPLPPPQVIPEGVEFRRTYTGDYDEVFRAAQDSFKEQPESPAVVNYERGLINSRSERLTAEQIRELVVAEDLPLVTGDGYAIVSLYFQPSPENGKNQTAVGAAALIAVDDDGGSPLGRVLTSNGTLEKSYLDAMGPGVQK